MSLLMVSGGAKALPWVIPGTASSKQDRRQQLQGSSQAFLSRLNSCKDLTSGWQSTLDPNSSSGQRWLVLINSHYALLKLQFVTLGEFPEEF